MLGSLGFFAFFLTSGTSTPEATSSSPSSQLSCRDDAAGVSLLSVREWPVVGWRLRLRLLSLEAGRGPS